MKYKVASVIPYRVIEIRIGIRHQTTIQFRKFSKPNRHMPRMKEKEKKKEFLKIDPHHCRNANGIFHISCRLWFPQILLIRGQLESESPCAVPLRAST